MSYPEGGNSPDRVFNLPQAHLENLRTQVRQTAASTQVAQPEFALRICWADSYDSLFLGRGTETDESAILRRVETEGRVILAGRGGAGKSQLLLRILRLSVDRGYVAILVRLQRWEKRDYELWQQTTKASVADGAAFLIDRFGCPETSVMELDWLPPMTKKLLIVDGLNEVSTPVGLQILQALDELTRNQIGMSALVADRLVRRDLPPPVRWSLGLVLPLSDESISKFSLGELAPGAARRLLDSPYFLDAALKKESILKGRALTHEEYFRTHGSLNTAELDLTGAAAFYAYQESCSRTISIESFISRTSDSIVGRLVEAGILVLEAGDGGHFSHHLMHDYLVARHVASLQAERWTRQTLEIMTLEQSSFDPVALAFEHLEGGRADQFLRHLYDWNLYATGYALGESSNGPLAPSVEMQTIIYAMLAEKRFDLVLQTRRRATDALLLIQSDIARHFAEAPTIEAVFHELMKLDSRAEWFVRWRELFVRDSAAGLVPSELEALRSDDSVIGWTAANVARRMHLTDGQLDALQNMLTQLTGTVRWRVAHVLGAFPSHENFAVLLQSFADSSDQLVQYGALRSLVEMAARADDPELRKAIVDSLVERIEVVERNSRLKDELARALVVDPAVVSGGWKHVVARFAREFFVRTEDPVQQDRWRAYVSDVEARYRNVRLQSGSG